MLITSLGCRAGLSAEWWRDGRTLARFVGDLLASELTRLRPGYVPPVGPWQADLRLGAGGLECDSLELLALATALAETLQMHRSEIEDYLPEKDAFGEWVGTAARSLERFSAALTFRTSGSTGKPKPCHHDRPDLDEEIGQLAALFPGRKRLLAAVPAHHLYGFLFSVLLPLRLDVPAVDVRALATARLSRTLEPGDLLVGHPVFWGAFSRTVAEIPPDVMGATSTAPIPDDVASSLTQNGLARLVQIYGSSETSGVGWRDDPRADYRLLDHWRRGDDEWPLIRLSATSGERPAAVPDRLVWSDERNFRVAGRCDDAVQVGGVNVFTQSVRARLCDHPAVAQAAVRLMRAEEGDRLKALIVPRRQDDDPALLRLALTEWCNARLSVAERPKSFTFGPALPTDPLGKAADWPIVR